MSQISTLCSHFPLRASSLTWVVSTSIVLHPSSSSHHKLAITLNNLYQTCWTHLASSNSFHRLLFFSKSVTKLPFSWFKIMVSTLADFFFTSPVRNEPDPSLCCFSSVSSPFLASSVLPTQLHHTLYRSFQLKTLLPHPS